MNATTTTPNTVLIGTTIHDEEIHIVHGVRYDTVTLDGRKIAGPFSSYRAALDNARTFVPDHRLAVKVAS